MTDLDSVFIASHRSANAISQEIERHRNEMIQAAKRDAEQNDKRGVIYQDGWMKITRGKFGDYRYRKIKMAMPRGAK